MVCGVSLTELNQVSTYARSGEGVLHHPAGLFLCPLWDAYGTQAKSNHGRKRKRLKG